MRTLQLARIAAEAEGLRLRTHAQRTAIRVVIGLIALMFLGWALAFAHAAIWYWLREDIGWPERGTAMALTAGDLVIAAFLARKVVTFAWTKATGKEPPTNPEDPGVALAEALSWSVLTGVTVAAMRILAVRAVSRKILSGPDGESANAADG